MVEALLISKMEIMEDSNDEFYAENSSISHHFLLLTRSEAFFFNGDAYFSARCRNQIFGTNSNLVRADF